ncbi:betaine aldehyde dehydrogenase [Tribonema minus]|uniref:Betaine aldehyde dehydrogenase n=1 Tax=Tribonema minus TaxID=303371 RepID=A0A835YWA1_9STRA|nr:betaine aldehyde dehydrogenase [Tribonema minus]
MAGFQARSGFFVGGQWVGAKSDKTFDVIDPATEQVLATFADASDADVDAAVTAAVTAKPAWGKTTGAQRAATMRAIAARVRDAKPTLARMEATNAGKPFPEAEWDVDDVAACFEYYAGLAEALDKRQWAKVDVGDDGYLARLRKEPIGVVAAVVPWNYPLLMATWKVAPALAAGCVVVLKPSELTPMTALELAALASDAGLPAGVLNVVTGTGGTGAAMVAHPGVDKITFTGSGPTGSRIMRTAAERVTPVTLELGGKSPAIVFDDAHLERTVEWVMFGCFWTNGQICSATSRLLLQEGLADKFLARLVSEVNKIKVGAPMDDDTKLGPLVSKAQQEKVLGFIERARGQGAKVLAGGARPSGLSTGWYVQPTVLGGVTADMEVWQSEIFGPVLSVMTFKTEAEAIALANGSEYGLASAVFSRDEAQLDRVTTQLEAGIVWQNCSQPCFCQLPWGGFKRSGVGRDLGEFGLENYLEPKQIVRYNKDEDLGWYQQAKL